MLILSDQSVGRGWRVVYLSEELRTLDQWLNVMNGAWRPSQYWTKDQVVNVGKVAYRRPVTLRAKAATVWAAIPKVWRLARLICWLKTQ